MNISENLTQRRLIRLEEETWQDALKRQARTLAELEKKINKSIITVHKKMVELAAPHMVSYHMDLLHDQRIITRFKDEVEFLWGYHDTGTHIGVLVWDGKKWTEGLLDYYGDELVWHHIHLVRGTVTPIGLNKAQQLVKEIKEVLE